MSLYHLYTAGTRLLPALQHRGIHLGFLLVLTFLLIPGKKGRGKEGSPSLLDWIFAALSAAVTVYIVARYPSLARSPGFAEPPDLVFGSIAIVLVLIASYRAVGAILPSL